MVMIGTVNDIGRIISINIPPRPVVGQPFDIEFGYANTATIDVRPSMIRKCSPSLTTHVFVCQEKAYVVISVRLDTEVFYATKVEICEQL